MLFITLLITINDLYTILPFIGLSVFCVIQALLLFFRAGGGGYVIIHGECKETILTTVRKRTKSIILDTEEHTVQIIVKQRLRRIPTGTVLDVYVAENTPVYEKDGIQLLHSYWAIDSKGGQNHGIGKGALRKTGEDKKPDTRK